MSNIWVTSDTHFGHKNIIYGSSEWENKDACRKFDTLEEHNALLIKNINDTVKKQDTLYCLGDWAFGGVENVYKFRKQLNVDRIHLILGNHDVHIEKNPIIKTDTGYKNIQNLFTTVSKIYEKKIGDKKFIFCHYPIYSWHGMRQSERSSFHLYGHVHGTLPSYNKYSMDVGIDTHPEFRPYHIEEIKKLLNIK